MDPADSSRTLIYATGIVNPGSWFESKYDLTSNFLKSGGGGETDLGLTAEDDDGDLEIDPRWTITGGDAELTDHGDGGGHGYGYGYGHGGGDGDEDGDIELETETNRVRVGRSWVTVYDAILLSLGWWKTNPDNPDLAQAWSSNSELLSYEVQVKVKIETMGSHGNYFMHGISFRLSPQNPDWDDDTIQSYGISYFKAANSSWPFNVDLGSSFNSIMNNSVYIVLWEKLSSNDTLTLLDYRRLTTSDDVIDGSGNLEDWSTILLKLEEKFDGPGGARQNHISGFVQGEDTIPLGTIDWDYDHYNSVQWHTHDPQPVTDSSLTTAGFSTSKPDEIGLHAFYDSVSSNKQYFADFSLKLGGAGGASSSFQW